MLTDVASPLLGPQGAAAVFGPQKCAGPDEVAGIENALAHWAGKLAAEPTTPGAGGAGGAAFGLLAWGCDTERGADAIAELIGLPEAIRGASFVITGEGSFDRQSAAGKVASVVLAHAIGRGSPVRWSPVV